MNIKHLSYINLFYALRLKHFHERNVSSKTNAPKNETKIIQDKTHNKILDTSAQVSKTRSIVKDIIAILCSTALELVSDKCIMKDKQKNDINGNILYISNVICSENQATVIDEGVFMQVQGRTALCGLCALNNAYQIDLFLVFKA